MNKVYCYCCYCYCLGWLGYDRHLPFPHPRPLFPSLNSQNKNLQSTINVLHQQLRWWNIDCSTQRVMLPFSGASVLGRWQFINWQGAYWPPGYSLLAYIRTRSGVPHWLVQLSLTVSWGGVQSFLPASFHLQSCPQLLAQWVHCFRLTSLLLGVRGYTVSSVLVINVLSVWISVFLFVGVYVPCIFSPARWELP